jgi:GTP cyclohydrolase I
MNYIDHSSKMPYLDFKYDADFYPEDSELPDPQLCPIIPGAKVPIQKVGIGPVDLPIKLVRRDGTEQTLHAKASLYGSLDDPESKGLNLSRFYLLMHDKVSNKLSIDGLKDTLKELQKKQNCKDAYCKLRFSYQWDQEALRTRVELPPTAPKKDIFKVVDGVSLSYDKLRGHIFYNCELEGQLHGDEYKFFLTVDYIYSSTCPCSFELSQDARERRGKAANGHSQRSIAKIKVQFNPDNIVWIEDVVELARQQVPTEVQIVVKRRDEQAFAELNGANLIFTEDASRLLYAGLDEWFKAGKIYDFSVVTEHIESLHPWSATAIIYKGIEGGLK